MTGDYQDVLKIYDCKTGKVVKSIKDIYTGLNWTRVYGSKLYYMTDTSVEYVKYKIKDGSSQILTMEEFQQEDIYYEKGDFI